MKGGRKVRVEDLVLPRLLATVDELYAVSEAVTTIALKPVVRAMLDAKTGPGVFFASMARTAVLFVIDFLEMAEATRSAAQYGSPRIELPPLPYPRIAVECAQDAVWQLANDQDEIVLELEFFAICEFEKGEQWGVVLATREPLGDDGDLGNTVPHVVIYTLTKDGRVQLWQNLGAAAPTTEELMQMSMENLQEKADANMEQVILEPEDPLAQLYRNIPVEFAHLVNARGVHVEELPIPRPERRRWGRRGLVHPQVYFVKIGGEDVESFPGHGDREYHCRWLVRGHWVYWSKTGTRSWRRAHIRGPAGAPWRGRPVYVVEPQEAA